MKPSGHAINDLLESIGKTDRGITCTGLSGSEIAFALSALKDHLNRPLCVVCATTKEMAQIRDDFLFFHSEKDRSVIAFPPYDILPFKPLSYRAETSCHRIGALYSMITRQEPPMVFTTVNGLLQKVIPKKSLSQFTEYVLAGEETDREAFIRILIQGGYQESVLVEEPGDFAVRGALVDVFPPLFENPVRIEFFGDTVDSIRTFGVQDQLSLASLSEVTILPAVETVLAASEVQDIAARIRIQGELLEMPGLRLEEIIERIGNHEQFPGIGGVLPVIFPEAPPLSNYFSHDTLFILIDTPAVETEAQELEEQLGKSYAAAFENGHLCVEPNHLFMTWTDTKNSISKKEHIRLDPISTEASETDTLHFVTDNNYLVSQQLKARADLEALFKPLADWVGGARLSHLDVTMVCRTKKEAERLNALLIPYGLDVRYVQTFSPPGKKQKGAKICLGTLSKGFVWERENMAIITEEEIFGHKRGLIKAERKRKKIPWLTFEDLKKGDLVVHEEHGVGQYGGLVSLDVGGVTNDFLLIAYRDGDKLYVPADRMNCVQKYVGVEGITPRLDKMGGNAWSRVKERVKKSIRRMAGQLLKLYAKRKVQRGYRFSKADRHYGEFESAFEYTETPDQHQAVQDVIQDMESSVPMDRLVCGDVGYGKTEIALRAAFKAVWDNKQVAFLVPTTVLAEQHGQTFKKRFQHYPVEIETLNRFRPASEQRAISQQLKNGQVDIVIGTHRLLQKDVHFKDLGLVIVDEEQRFGVAHKEKLKQLCETVDYLALTATPIPRTLHMSLMGIRDLSVIATPPEFRYPIKTYISTLNDTVIAEALYRELHRGGQVFFVHNNIKTIRAMARRLEGLVPQIRLGIAHGQLEDEALERVMLQFLYREIDCLVCTTIIESGLDFSSANTILINRADKLGLSQIYQLRGRVGRADEQAYAYLFIPHENALTRHAQKRLKVLMEHSDLGSGFQIAMSDLQIRGSGTVLGPTQSGQIASVGHEMYLQLMEHTMAELKGESMEPRLEPEIVADFSAFIPEHYITHIDQRMTFYRRLAKVSDLDEIQVIRDELTDRFGPLPEEVATLLSKMVVKVMCHRLGVKRVEIRSSNVTVTFTEKTPVTPERIMDLVEDPSHGYRLMSDYVLQAGLPSGITIGPMEAAKKILQDIAV